MVFLGFVIPLLQIVFGSLLHSLLQNQLGPGLGTSSTWPLTQAAWREEASFAENIELFRKAAPCCEHFVKSFPTLRQADTLFGRPIEHTSASM